MIGPPLASGVLGCRCGWSRVHAVAIGERTAVSAARKRLLAAASVGAALLLLTLPTVGALLVAAFLGLWLSSGRTGTSSRRLKAIELAGRHAEAGNLDVAAQLLGEAAGTDNVTGDYARAALAIVCLRQGQPGQAVWLLRSLLDEPRPRCTTLRRLLRHALAYTHAAGGKVDVPASARSATTALRCENSPLKYLLLCQQRRFSEMAAISLAPQLRLRLIPTGSALATAHLGWHGERVVALLSAFALSRHDATVPQDTEPNIAPFLAAAKPTYPGEYDYLKEDWPDLRSFIDDHSERLRASPSVHVSLKIPRAAIRKRSRSSVGAAGRDY